jgi:phytoene synthase
VREDDKDRFLAALFAPAALRGGLFALYAFDLEISGVAQRVHEPQAGEIRLQWWRDVAEGFRDAEARASPIAAALVETIAAADLPRDPILSAIDAHALDLAQAPFADVQALEDYGRDTGGAILQLAALALDPSADRALLRAAAEPAGIAITVVNILRRFAHDVARGQVRVPSDLLAHHKVAVDQVLAGVASPALTEALADLRAHGRRHYDAAVAGMRDVAVATRPAFLVARLAPLYFRWMEPAAREPFSVAAEVSQWRRQLALWRAARSWR